MARVCEVSGKRALTGNRVSHANNKTKRTQQVNLQRKRFWSEAEGRWVRLRVSTRVIKAAGKVGIDAVLKKAKR